PMTHINPKAPVLVTGAAGYIASWLVKYLLEAGHTVHGTVRNPDKKRGLEHMQELRIQHPGKLRLFAADLLKPGSFDAAMKGCELVMHTASPFVISGFTDANEALVRPALEGTRNVLEAANRTRGVKRVVLTSSEAAIYGDNIDAKDAPNNTLDENSWNTTSSLEHQPYPYSKVVAEREAWAIQQKQSRWDLVTINPGLVLGPSLTQSSASTSLVFIKQLSNGTMALGAPHLPMGVVDVRDVALAHIKAGFIPEARGRHVTSACDATPLEMGRLLRKRFGSKYLFPRFEAPKFMVKLMAPAAGLTRKYVELNVGHPLHFDNSKSRRELKMEYRPLEETLADHFSQLLDDGVIRRRE
ncbi:MAG: SDR family oxidoreductase, partial [Stenotrophobium sp.]